MSLVQLRCFIRLFADLLTVSRGAHTDEANAKEKLRLNVEREKADVQAQGKMKWQAVRFSDG